MFSLIRRNVNLDDEAQISSINWIRVLHRDDHGPLVIAIDDATVFGDGGVESNGKTLESVRFGVPGGKHVATTNVTVSGSIALVTTETALRSEALDSLGPRLATIGRLLPETPVLASPSRIKLADFARRLNFSVAGTIIPKGRSWSADSVLLVRLPKSGSGSTSFDDTAQRRAFVDAMTGTVALGAPVFLEHTDPGWGESRAADSSTRFRLPALRGGFSALSVGRRSLAEVVEAVAGAPSVILESPILASYAQFARPDATVAVIDSHTTPSGLEPLLASARRPPNKPAVAVEFTVDREVDMDALIRTGGPFPDGVEVVESPVEPVATTSLHLNRSFRNGRWHGVDDTALGATSVGRWVFRITEPRVNAAGDIVLRDGTRLTGLYFGAPVTAHADGGIVTSSFDRPVGLSLSMPNAFGHSLLQVMPRLESVHRARADIDVLIGKRLWDDAPLVERLGVPAKRVTRIPQFEIDEYFEVPEVYVSTHLQPHHRTARVDPAWLAEFVGRLTGSDVPEPTRKIYFARAADSGARGGCVNRDELDRIADEFGYERVYPERHSVTEQIRILSECSEMLGEQGSALNWTFVMQPGTRVTTVRNYPLSRGNAFETFHNPMLAARGVAYRDIAGFAVGNSTQYEIDPAVVRAAIGSLP